MTEAVVHPHDEAERPRCAACETPLHGVFCHACGQHHADDANGLSFLARDAFAEVFSLEGKTAHTLRDMMVRPGLLLGSWRAGSGERFFSPFKLLLVVSAFFFVFVSWIHVPIYQYLPFKTGGPVRVQLIDGGIDITGAEYRDVFLRPGKTATLPELERALDQARAAADSRQAEAIDLYRAYNKAFTGMNDFWNDWLPRLLWLLAPFYGLLLMAFFWKRTLAEHLVFTIWAHCFCFAVLMAVALINLTGAALPSALLFPVYLVAFTFAASGFYGVTRVQAALIGAGHLAAYFCVVWFPVIFGMSLAWGADHVNIWRYMEGYDPIATGHERLVVPEPEASTGGGPPQTVSPPPGSR